VNTQARSAVRQAQPGDAEQVAALLAELGYPDNPVEQVRQRLAMWVHRETSLVLVADRNGQELGVVAVTAIPHLEHEGRWGRIVALVVSAACRGQGIGNSSKPPRKQPANSAASPWRSPAPAAALSPIPSTRTWATGTGETTAPATSKTVSPVPPRPATPPDSRQHPVTKQAPRMSTLLTALLYAFQAILVLAGFGGV